MAKANPKAAAAAERRRRRRRRQTLQVVLLLRHLLMLRLLLLRVELLRKLLLGMAVRFQHVLRVLRLCKLRLWSSIRLLGLAVHGMLPCCRLLLPRLLQLRRQGRHHATGRGVRKTTLWGW